MSVEGQAPETPTRADPGVPQDPELLDVLGTDLRVPVKIPKAYQPNELSGHDLLRVELTDFRGPLDLLLFLIRQHDLDIFDIPIAFITHRYLETLDRLTILPIDVAAEFLVMAAELLHIKSKMLLPPKEGVPVDAVPSEPEGDPRADLVRRLLEVQKYRDAAGHLGGRDLLGARVFARIAPALEGDFDPGLRDTSIFRLVEAWADVLSRLKPSKQHAVTTDRITIAECIRRVAALGALHGSRLAFSSLFTGGESRQEIAMTFLAILEMARLGMALLHQDPEPVPEPPPLPKRRRKKGEQQEVEVVPFFEAEPNEPEVPSSFDSIEEEGPVYVPDPTLRARSPLDPPKPAEIWIELTEKKVDPILLRALDAEERPQPEEEETAFSDVSPEEEAELEGAPDPFEDEVEPELAPDEAPKRAPRRRAREEDADRLIEEAKASIESARALIDEDEPKDDE
ncbi:MAG: segregation/condensation protein A [Deltaproteobacteria bacterium]|nr:segregation/condensation protein A [Deltaproteobacteria bacterium]